ncbi:hypothetical protein Vafri_3819 [Volvox africanus]|uniref:Suppressor of white apricot N-terminal domain-containing protein n=1 Tax=Volvox africanus TaxID=51714 RepID=A0A8J4AX22_9CHLO|nr:hypothetical protein Vafri_3819 [Volvox africanus]
MASYYHDARAHARKLKEISEDNKRRAERKAEIAETQVEHPLNYLFVEGRSCKIFRNSEQHQNLENGIGLIPWGNGGTLIDRFDGRALLDFYKEPDASAWTRPKAPQEEKLDQSLRFESFRDVVRLATKGLSEPEGLAFARQENIEIRAAMRAAATAAAAAAAGQRNPPPLSMAMPMAGTGAFSAVGFNYGGAAAGGGGSSDSSSDDDSSDSESDGDEDEDAGQEAEDDRIDDIAEQYGLTDFSYRLHRALQQEGEEEARLRKPPRRRVSRKNTRERTRRMAGMGLDPTGAPIGTARDWTQPPPRSAAQDNIRIIPPRQPREVGEDGGYRRRRSRSGSRSRSRSRTPSRSRSPRRHRHTESGHTQYITEFSSASAPGGSRTGVSSRGGGHGGCGGVAVVLAQQQHQAVNRPTIDRSMFERDEAILDALPDMPDPAALGPQSIPLPPTTVQAIRAAAAEGGRREARTGVGGGSGGSRRERERDERERERERERNYHGYSYRRRYEQPHRDSLSRSRSRSRERERDWDRERKHERDRGGKEHDRPGGGNSGGGGSSEVERVRDRQLSGSGVSTSGYGATKAPLATASGAAVGSKSTATTATGSGASAVTAPGALAKETPQERLKRIMAAQLNKQAQKDHLVATQRKLQVGMRRGRQISGGSSSGARAAGALWRVVRTLRASHLSPGLLP